MTDDDDATPFADRGEATKDIRPPLRVLLRANIAAVIYVTLALIIVAVLATKPWTELRVALTLLAPVAALATIVDIRLRIIPRPLPWAAAGLAIVVFGVAAIVRGDGNRIVGAVAAGGVVGLVYAMLWRFTGLGFGDVRLAGALALYAGWPGWTTALGFIVLAHVITLPIALWCAARGRRRDIPLAPGLVAALYFAIASTEAFH